VSLLLPYALHARTFLFFNSYIGPYQRFDYFYPQHPVPIHQTRDTRRNWIVVGGRGYTRSHISRMIVVESRRGWLTERLRFLSRVFCYLPFKYLVLDFLAPLCLSVRSPSAAAFYSEAEAAVISSPPIFPLPGLAGAYTGTHSDQ